MGMPAARVSDMTMHDGPHCHAGIHPPPPAGPVPAPHPSVPMAIIKGATKTMIGNLPAARVTDQTAPCMLVPCVPGGPGMVAMGSTTVMIENMPAARVNDMVSFSTCILVPPAGIPMPTGKILPPGCPTVIIGG